MNPLLQLLMFSILPTKMPFFMKPIARTFCGGIVSNVTVSHVVVAFPIICSHLLRSCMRMSPQKPALKKNFAFLENELKKAGGDYFVGGKLTGADIMLSFPVVSRMQIVAV